MEKLDLGLFAGLYDKKRVVITGHTGFKGSWLALWLLQIGAEVKGISLPPCDESLHWSSLGLRIQEDLVDIRDIDAVRRSIKAFDPDIVFHLAAQSLVRRSYRDPLSTWSTNVLGTANILESCRDLPSLKAIVVVTTDKCYENKGWHWGYRETDSLGGHDPYSASKSCAELVAQSYRLAFFNNERSPLIATVRAGNVIGGGDWSEDRLIPDLVRAVFEGKSLEVRSPASTRPWQHVLDCISAYLLLGQNLLQDNKDAADAWNFGPSRESNQTVSTVLSQMGKYWPEMQWHRTSTQQPHEASVLFLDSSKAQSVLGWRPVWDLDASLSKTARWYQSFLNNRIPISTSQIREYVDEACGQDLCWTR